ncbi:Lrp/AsnC family transcriptional regulator [Nesterenkonia sp. K-15-9-6]|uniref:Lrp/AsnC family transcriptional regulator n=1 Tax=Nesterenkonia sp. K-15-9-6 TaxID=3093918 RepID=UPI004043C420
MQDSVSDVPDVQDPIRLQENDLRLIQALQISPRAGWSELGRALGAAPTTVARRWERLESSGAAWVSCQPLHGRDSAIAVLEVVCRAGDILQAARTLAEDAAAMTIDVTAGGRDLLITVTCPDQLALGRYLLERVAQIPEVESVRSHVVTRVYLDASRWRLRSLTSREESRISSALPPPGSTSAPTMDALERKLVEKLSVDGRRSVQRLAEDLDVSESTVRRRLRSLTDAGALRLRCEVARGLTEWHVLEWFFLRVPPAHIDEAGQVLSGIPELRAVLSTTGPANVIVAAWLRTVADGQRLERRLTQLLPWMEVIDRSVVLRPVKLVGRLLDARGLAVGTVPLRGDGGRHGW